MDIFDFIIIGGGSAGSILAHRLGEAGKSVCVLEAGPPDRNPFIRMPAGFVKTLFDPKLTWQFEHSGSEGTAGRSIQVTQGRTLGGSSSVNGAVYNRGQAADFDHWAQLGNAGWDFKSVLPYFRRTERRIGPGDDTYRGRDGALPITTHAWRDKVCDAFIRAAEAAGVPRNDDSNGASQAGVGYYQSAIERGRRVSAAHAFLHPARKRFAVDVRTDVLAHGIELEDGRAVAVRYRRSGTQEPARIRARAGVIVSAGTVNSPKLLQLSGIGPGALLQQHGIAVLRHLPGVGENFRDHYSPRLVARTRPGTDGINKRVTGLPLAREFAAWLVGRPSVLALSPALVHVFWKTDPALDNPDFSLVFTPGSYKRGFIGRLDDFPGLTCGVWQMRPESRGHVRITSPDPLAKPELQPNYLGSEFDRRTLVAALRFADSLLRRTEMKDVIEEIIIPEKPARTDNDWLDFARDYGSSSYHLVGTCKMGPGTDPLAVVDPGLKVHGLDGLYVVDASVMPTMPSANTYAATLMIAERGADLILNGNA